MGCILREDVSDQQWRKLIRVLLYGSFLDRRNVSMIRPIIYYVIILSGPFENEEDLPTIDLQRTILPGQVKDTSLFWTSLAPANIYLFLVAQTRPNRATHRSKKLSDGTSLHRTANHHPHRDLRVHSLNYGVVDHRSYEVFYSLFVGERVRIGFW